MTIMPSLMYAQCHLLDHYVECHAEWRGPHSLQQRKTISSGLFWKPCTTKRNIVTPPPICGHMREWIDCSLAWPACLVLVE